MAQQGCQPQSGVGWQDSQGAVTGESPGRVAFPACLAGRQPLFVLPAIFPPLLTAGYPPPTPISYHPPPRQKKNKKKTCNKATSIRAPRSYKQGRRWRRKSRDKRRRDEREGNRWPRERKGDYWEADRRWRHNDSVHEKALKEKFIRERRKKNRQVRIIQLWNLKEEHQGSKLTGGAQ